MGTQEKLEITVFENPEALREQVASYRSDLGQDIVALAELGGGAVRFANAVFPNSSIDNVYAQRNEREHEGRGPHFDIYNEGVSEDYPWLGVYNLAGACTVTAALMPQKLSDEYFRLYPEPNDAAYDARRHFGAVVLDSDAVESRTGVMKPDMGLVLPQQASGPHIIHEVIPTTPSKPGSFIKMIVPKQEASVLETLRGSNFMPLDELLTKGADEQPNDLDALVAPTLPTSVPEPDRPPRRGRRPRIGRRPRSSSSDGLGLLD